MSRSGYSEDCEQWPLIMYRGAVASAIRGKRGQAFLREMLTALDAMPKKELVAHELQHSGQVCAIGAVGKSRSIDLAAIDPEDAEKVAHIFGISAALAREIVYENDEAVWTTETPAQRFSRMRAWCVRHIAKET